MADILTAGQQAAEHLADDDGGKTDNDGAGTHANVGILLALADERTRKANEGVGEHEGDHFGGVGVDA